MDINSYCSSLSLYNKDMIAVISTDPNELGHNERMDMAKSHLSNIKILYISMMVLKTEPSVLLFLFSMINQKTLY